MKTDVTVLPKQKLQNAEYTLLAVASSTRVTRHNIIKRKLDLHQGQKYNRQIKEKAQGGAIAKAATATESSHTTGSSTKSSVTGVNKPEVRSTCNRILCKRK